MAFSFTTSVCRCPGRSEVCEVIGKLGFGRNGCNGAAVEVEDAECQGILRICGPENAVADGYLEPLVQLELIESCGTVAKRITSIASMSCSRSPSVAWFTTILSPSKVMLITSVMSYLWEVPLYSFTSQDIFFVSAEAPAASRGRRHQHYGLFHLFCSFDCDG